MAIENGTFSLLILPINYTKVVIFHCKFLVYQRAFVSSTHPQPISDEDREERFAHVFTKLRGLGLTEYEKARRLGRISEKLVIQVMPKKNLAKTESIGT